MSTLRRCIAATIATLTVTVGLCLPAPSASAATRPKVLLLGDSTMAALVWYGSSQANLRGVDYVLEAASCRAVTARSCVGRRDKNGQRIRPSNALTVLQSYPKGTFDELVMMAGYDEGYDTFKQSIIDFPRIARERGVKHITWLTFRTDVDYQAPTKVSYHGNNRLLIDAAKSSGGYISLLDWNYWVKTNGGLVERDGVHLTSKGAFSLATLIKQAVINYWGSGAVSSRGSGGGSSSGGSPTLSYGSSGDAVVEMQKLLLAMGSKQLAPYGATGRYFIVTSDAVKDFQRFVKSGYDRTVVVDGVVGSQTWTWLRNLSAKGVKITAASAPTTPSGSSPTLRFGDVNDSVKSAQAMLLRIGAPLLEPHGATGRYFAATEDTVKYFQQLVRNQHDSTMTVDGVIGAKTWTWLRKLDPGVS